MAAVSRRPSLLVLFSLYCLLLTLSIHARSEHHIQHRPREIRLSSAALGWRDRRDGQLHHYLLLRNHSRPLDPLYRRWYGLFPRALRVRYAPKKRRGQLGPPPGLHQRHRQQHHRRRRVRHLPEPGYHRYQQQPCGHRHQLHQLHGVHRRHITDEEPHVQQHDGGDCQDQERPVAIKVFSSESSAQGRKEFEAEVRIISRLKHRNLVQLLGWCDSHSGLLLVYELVAGGSLDRHLHSPDRLLTWPERYQIILGLGSPLRYLHQEWEQCVVHGNIKPSNIMLDEWHGVKLGDFGLARLGDHGARWQTTKAVLGTAGYIDPEFANTRHPSTESDVYSFGIVLLEVVSGRAPVVLPEPGGGGLPFVLLKWVWGLYGRNEILDAVDERLRALGAAVHGARAGRRAVVRAP
ncbi:hypothetical protein BS78_05G258200 [Paspalum vaginatum]|nr:hypothetical protein BS78_05G258200 [Paspalum vaginatum]